MERTHVEVVAEAHLVIGSSVTDELEKAVRRRARGAGRVQRAAAVDRLEDRDELALSDERVTETGSERARRRNESRNRKAGNSALLARIRGVGNPFEVTAL